MKYKPQFKWLVPTLLLISGILAACALPLAQLQQGQPQTSISSTGQPALTWQGPAEMGSTETPQCASLEINGEQAVVETCEGATQTVTLEARYGQEWAEIQERFAAFVYESPTERLVFDGNGSISGPAAERALLAWARARYAELSSGRVSAAAHTVMSWHLGQIMERKNTCRHLTVLSWGYATAETIMCEGQDVMESAPGWLEPAELEQLDQWLYERAVFSQDNNYIAGTGAQPLSAAESANVEQWAMALWERLWAANIIQPATQPATCAVPSPSTRLFVDEVHRYCLLYPADYTVERTSPNEVNIVRGSVMNHVDPRVAITAGDASGRTLAQLVDQLEAEYAPAGMNVERGSITVGGVEAVLLDNLPGQDLNRRVVLIHNGRLYIFFFTPLGEPGPARIQMETFYQQILDSFRFLDETVPTPTPDPAAVPIVPTDVQYIMAQVNVNIRRGPGTNYEIVGRIFAGQTAQVTGVTADGGWWRVICPDGTAGNCFAVADPTLTQPASVPGDPPPTAGPIQETGSAVVESLEVQLLESFPVQGNAVLRGYYPDACTVIDSYDQVMAGPTIRLRMTTRRTAEQCAQVLTPFEQIIPLNIMGLPAGSYDVRINELVAPFSLSVDNEPGLPATYATDVEYVMAQTDINIYARPGVDEPAIGTVAAGMIARVTGATEDGGWWRVICPDDSDLGCWVQADPALTQPTTPP
jgi:uncharacterized protein YraI